MTTGKVDLRWHAGLCAVLLFVSNARGDDAGVAATSIRLSADAAITQAWIDGRAIPLGAHAKDWSHPDDYGPQSGLRCLAVSAASGPGLGRTGFIGAVVLAGGQWVVTDETWKAWNGEGEPPADAKGRPWTAVDYDDSTWPAATEIGPYGCGPWGAGKESLPYPGGKFTSSADTAGSVAGELSGGDGAITPLDRAMRLTGPAPQNPQHSRLLEMTPNLVIPAGTDIGCFLDFTEGTPVQKWNADWIWAGPPLGGASTAYFRKLFVGGNGTPPSRPQDPHLTAVTPTKFTLAWQPSFSTQGPVTYELAWNGQVMLKTSATSGTVDGITINPHPQNYAWVRAVAPDGTRSEPSPFVPIAMPSNEVPGAPTHLRVTGRSTSGLSVAWDPAPDAGTLSLYEVLVNNIGCLVPPGVCSLSADFPKFIAPGVPVTVEVRAQDIGDQVGPSATVEDWTLPKNPVPLPVPTGLRLAAGKLAWNATPGASGYRLWRDGVAVPGCVTGTTAPVPDGPTDGFVQIMAVDQMGNSSRRSAPLVVGRPSTPQAPTVSDGGHSGNLAVLRWTRPAVGTCVGYRVEMDNAGHWSALGQIDDPWQNQYLVGQLEDYHMATGDCLPGAGASPGTALEPGTSYRFRVVALGADRGEVASVPLSITTVAPPSPHPRLRFAVIVATDGRYDYLDRSLADADEANCAFAFVKGQLVPQLSHDPKQWDSLMQVVHRHRVKTVLALLASKDTWNTVSDFTSSWSAATGANFLGRYDMGPWRTGQPLDQVDSELGGALRMVGVLENARSNPHFMPDLERSLEDAEGAGSCRWLFTGGVTTEEAPSGIVRTMLELYRPEVDFMRMINGDRGHELSLDPGSAVACACPQRNRVGAHYLVTVEDQRLVFDSRQYDAKTKAFVTDGLQEIAYDRASNRIAAANLRIPYPFGIVTGLPQRADHPPPWTQNRIVSCLPGGQAEVHLLGRSALGLPLSFTVTRPPGNGTLTGTGDEWVYHPKLGFEGEDLFLYRADDGGPWPGNTAWVRITVRATSDGN